MKKLEKFCNKLKAKKYRNCGSQTENDVSMEQIVSKKRHEKCKSTLVGKSEETIRDQENKNILFLKSQNGSNLNDNFSKIMIGQSISEDRNSKNELKDQIQLKIQQFQQAIQMSNESRIPSNVTTTRRGPNLDPAIVQEHIYDSHNTNFDGNKVQYKVLSKKQANLEPNMGSASPISLQKSPIQDIDYNEIILKEIGNITEQSQITRGHNADANIDDKSQNKSLIKEMNQFNQSKYFEESRQLEDSLNHD